MPSVYQSADAPRLPSLGGRDFSAGTTSTRPARVEAWRYYPEYVREQVNEWSAGTPMCGSQAAMLDIEMNGRRAILLVLVSFRDGYYEIEHQYLGIFGSGRTQAEAVQDLIGFLYADYQQYALAPDEDLDDAARELARRYRRLFGIQR